MAQDFENEDEVVDIIDEGEAELQELEALKQELEAQSIRIILDGYEKVQKGKADSLPDSDIYLFFGNSPVECACVAVIPMNGSVYTLLKPLEPIDGFPEDNSFCYEIVNDGASGYFDIIESEIICNAVFKKYLESKN